MAGRHRKKQKLGRPRGSGKPIEEVRRHRVAVMLNDAELADLEALSEVEGLPLSTIAHQLMVSRMRSKLRTGARRS